MACFHNFLDLVPTRFMYRPLVSYLYPANSPGEYFRISIVIPFRIHIYLKYVYCHFVKHPRRMLRSVFGVDPPPRQIIMKKVNYPTYKFNSNIFFSKTIPKCFTAFVTVYNVSRISGLRTLFSDEITTSSIGRVQHGDTVNMRAHLVHK